MPDLMDRLYCSEQIHIPPTFPFIMKLYCKAAIRTQPYDLLKWSAAYFRALANGEDPPVKDRIEYPPYDSPTGLTPGYIKMLLKQLGKDPQTTVSAQTLFIKWNCVCLDDELLVKLVALIGARTRFNWLQFIAVACGFISTSLTNTMILLCELLTDEPEGGMATIPLDVFNDLYAYLANMECGPLTEKELKEIEEKDFEEDVSVIAERIRTAVYEGEGEGEFAVEFPGEAGEREIRGEDLMTEEKQLEEPEKDVAQTTRLDETVDIKDIKEDDQADDESSEESKDLSGGNLESKESLRYDDGGSLDEEKRSSHGTISESGAEEVIKEEDFPEVGDELKSKEKLIEDKAEVKSISDSEKKQVRKIKLEDFEESVRRKIEEKLKEDEESIRSTGSFEELGSYLLDAAARVKAYTAEEIGYRIFKKYLRQEVPGIGPKIGRTEVEKVLDFMDYNAHKQQGMVMPRNIRHWMCPPLDKVPTPEP